MPYPTCAYGREQLSDSDWSVVVGSGGELASNTYYFSLQGRNRSGLDKPVYSSAISVPSNGKVTITINQSANQSGEDWLSYVISASTSNAANTFAQIAVIPNTGSFPLTLTFSKPEQLLLAAIVATPETLPVNDLINGNLRSVTSLNAIYQYNFYDTVSLVDNINVLAAAQGRWKRTGGFFTNVVDVKAVNGCGQDLRYVTSLDYVNYLPSSASSDEAKLWVINDSNSTIESGTGVSLQLSMGGNDVAGSFDNKLSLKFLGYVNLATGELDTSAMTGVNVEIPYKIGQTSFTLSKNLPSGYAFAFSVSLRFTTAEINIAIANGATLSIIPGFTTSTDNTVDNIDLIGDCVYVTNEEYTNTLRRIVPSVALTAIALPGKGAIEPYKFYKTTTQVITGLQSNTADQKAAISGTTGNCFITNNIPAGSALRALVGTLAGESTISNYSSPVTVTGNSSLSVTVNYPCNSSGKGTIRASYPDVIAGYTEGDFNPKSVNLYISNGTAIKKFSNNLVVYQPNQIFTITDWNAGTLVTSLPSTPFGLYQPGLVSASVLAGGGTIPSGTYSVAYSFVYDGSQITDIDHQNSSCITELTSAVTKIFERSNYWGVPLTLSDIRNISLSDLRNGYEIKLIKSNGSVVSAVYHSTSTTVDDDGVTSIRPNVISANHQGRFLIGGDSVAGSASGLSYKGIWSSTTTYDETAVVTHNNSTWAAVANSIGIDPSNDNGTYWKILVKGIRNRGVYDVDTTYSLNDLVVTGDESQDTYLYINTASTATNPVSNTAYWLPIGKRGTQGIPGESITYNPRGDYDNTATYSDRDWVYYDTTGKSYIYYFPTPASGVLPTDDTHWQANGVGGGEVVSFNGRNGAVELLASDILDDSIADTKIGNRTADSNLVADGLTYSITGWFSRIANKFKAILGTTNWYDAVPTTLAAAKSHQNSTTNPHNVTPAQVGNTTAQWNANQIAGVVVDDTAKGDLKALLYSLSADKIIYGTVSSSGETGGNYDTAISQLQTEINSLKNRVLILEGGTPEPSSTALLMHFDGVNGSISFVDEAGHSVTRTGNVQISTAQSKFGGSSLWLPGDGALQITSGGVGSNLDLAGNDFTIDFWYYHLERTNTSSILTWDGADYPLILYNASSLGDLLFAVGSHSSWFVPNLSVGGVASSTWTHYAVTRQGDIFRSFKNGSLVATATGSGVVGAPTTITVGGHGGSNVTAYLDELRILNGTCAYTQNFIPNTVAYS